MTDLKHYIQIGSGRCECSLHLLRETYTLRRLIAGGATENCAVMVENAERLIWVHFAAIISLSLSSNKRWREKKKGNAPLLNLRCECDIMLTIQCVGTVQTDAGISMRAITVCSRLGLALCWGVIAQLSGISPSEKIGLGTTAFQIYKRRYCMDRNLLLLLICI